LVSTLGNKEKMRADDLTWDRKKLVGKMKWQQPSRSRCLTNKAATGYLHVRH
jgi:hypothetical protein